MSLPININKLITGKIVESERIEFKKGWNPEAVMHSICAFANDINNWGGGYIVLGIDENNGSPILPPEGLKRSEIDLIQKKILEISNLIHPRCCPVISPEIYQNKHILVLWINGGDNRPYNAPDKYAVKDSNRSYWIRVGSSTIKANRQEERKLFELANKTPFDDRVNHNTSIHEFNLSLISSFLKEVKSDLYEQIGKLSLKDLSKKMIIAKGPKEDLKPLNVGLLLFSDKPESYFPGCKIEIVVYKDKIGDTLEESTFTGPIHDQLRNALKFIKSNIIKEKIIKVPGQAESIRKYNYPYEAIEESLANAVYHRSYELQNPIEIQIRLDKMEILSFPGPLPPLNKKALKKKQVIARDYRNRRIGDFLKELHLTEGRATGFPKIRNSMKKNGSPSPVFDTDNNLTYFLTSLPCHPLFFDLEITMLQRTVLKFCRIARKRSEIMPYLGFTNDYRRAKKIIQPLLDFEYLEYAFPDTPQTPKQKYVTTALGIDKLSK